MIGDLRGAPLRMRARRGGRLLHFFVAIPLCLATALEAQDSKLRDDTPKARAAEASPNADLVPAPIELPKPAFKGTPKHAPPGANLEPPRSGPRPAMMAPKGVANLARGKPVTSSDNEPIIGKLEFVTDGNKEAEEGTYVELGPGVQWVQIDLGQPSVIWGVLIWHYHNNARIYHDVVVQVSDDPAFRKDVKLIFNNDHDNSSGLGRGEDKEFWETFEGKLIETRGVSGRYVRLYSNGSIADDQNHYTEVEVFGLPVK